MASQLLLRFKLIKTVEDGMEVWESNLFQVNGKSAYHLEMAGDGNSVNVLHSLTGDHFVSCQHDYFGDIGEEFIKHPAIGQVVKLRLNHCPTFGIVVGDVIDMGDPEEDGTVPNAFAGSEGEYFRDNQASYFLGKNQ